MKDVQNKQQQRIIFSSTLKSNLAATSNNLANKIDLVYRKLNFTSEKQLELTSDLRDHGHGNKQRLDQLASHIQNFANDFKLIDQQMETVQQKQNELSRLGKGNDQKINVLTENIRRFEEKLTSDIRNHGNGNKQRIEQLTSQIKNFISQDVLDQRMNDSLTNITFYINQIERQAFENITDLSSEMNNTRKRMDVLWINLLDSKDLVVPILENYAIYRPAADIISRMPYVNATLDNAIRSAINDIDLNETSEYKRIVTSRIPSVPNDIKLHPIDSNLKKVKYSFTVQFFEKNNLYFVSGSFDG